MPKLNTLHMQAQSTLPTILANAAAAAAALNKQSLMMGFAMHNAKRLRTALKPSLARASVAAQANAAADARAAIGAQIFTLQTAQADAAAATAAINSALRALCRLLPVDSA